MRLEWYILGFCYARRKPAPYKMYSMFYMMNISGLGLKNPYTRPDLDSILVYALFTIILLRDRYICKCHTCIYCIGVVRDEPYRLHQYRKQNMTTEATTDDFIRSHILVCGIPHHDFVPTTECTETTPIIMTTTEATTEAQTTEPTTEDVFQSVMSTITKLGTAKGSRVASTLATIEGLKQYESFNAHAKTYNLAKNICKRIGIDVIELMATVIYHHTMEIIEAIDDAKLTKTTSRAGGVLHSETVTYAVRLINGGLLRSTRVADALERVALRMVASGDFNITDMPVSLDKELNKAYAAIRSQATKNNEELGGKSNTVTKEATKEAIVKAIRIMKETDSYEYDILIGNLPEQPKHLKE